MKKINILILAFALMSTISLNAQDAAFGKGKTVVTLGYGFPNLARIGLRIIYSGSAYQNTTISGFGPILLKGDYGILKNLGVGAVIGYSNTKLDLVGTDSHYNNNTGYTENYNYYASLHWSSLSIGAHANYHFVTKEKVDAYVGGGAGYTINTISYTVNDPYQQTHGTLAYNPNTVYFGVTVGLRYYFSPNIGVYAEGGFEKGSILQGGMAVKF